MTNPPECGSALSCWPCFWQGVSNEFIICVYRVYKCDHRHPSVTMIISLYLMMYTAACINPEERRSSSSLHLSENIHYVREKLYYHVMSWYVDKYYKHDNVTAQCQIWAASCKLCKLIHHISHTVIMISGPWNKQFLGGWSK